MPRYVFIECQDSAIALQRSLDRMSSDGWRLKQAMWTPQHKIWENGTTRDESAGYTIIFEKEDADAHRT